LELIDQARTWGLAARIVVADAGCGNVTAFREALEQRNLPYAVGVQSSTGVWPMPRRRQLRPPPAGRPASITVAFRPHF
jgi:SRSO17 transposase